MVSYRLRDDRDLRRRALDKGIDPTGSAIAAAIGLPATTVNYVRNGRAPQSSTIATFVRFFGCDVEDLFEIVDDDKTVGVGA